MWTYKKLNLYSGWLMWAIATIVYFSTLEPTVSFWDCGEFISTGYKLEVGHPPGAPLYMLLARFFSMFAGDNLQLVAIMINTLSALASSFTILFLFWSVTYIAQKIITTALCELEKNRTILILTTGAIAALSYAFTDTFWFSAVEGEVYALSSLFTAVVFWAILRWEDSQNNKWLILIAYLIGLSIGVHLLNLLAIPAIVLIYYYKKYTPTTRGVLIAGIASLCFVGILMWIFIPGITKVASWFDFLFVNGFGLPFNSGFIAYCIILISLIIVGLYLTHAYGKVLANKILLIATVLLIGYSSYAVIIVRSNANPPMDENNPDNPFALLSYLNREQYGDNPLFYGQTYNAPIIDITEGPTIYSTIDGKYDDSYSIPTPKYDKNFMVFFPRMWSNQPDHIKAYKQWAGIEDGKNTIPIGMYGQTFEKPTFLQNLTFFFSYQLGYMYFRYFMWNFAGRQNDLQGNGEPHKGNWISGISFIDDFRLGPQDAMPQALQTNKAKNTYFMFPFILGLLGIVYLWRKNRAYSNVIITLFIFTGIAIVVYLNQYPFQPRERDYAYAGSFYVFSMWIGFGFIGLYALIKKYVSKHAIYISIGTASICPILLFAENFDDHNRSNRYIARDFSKNYLESCDSNAILFTYGDNDTFPLWYLQEVENIRTDVRVINLSLFNKDWYINQMKRRAYNSAPIKLSLPESKYKTGTNEEIFVLAHSKISHVFYPIKDIIDIIKSNDENLKARKNDGTLVDYIPVPNIIIPVNKANALRSGIITTQDTSRMIAGIPFSLLQINSDGIILDSTLSKSKLMTLDILSNYNWSYPIYFSTSVGTENYMNLQNNLFLEGLAYNLKPLEANFDTNIEGQINTEKMYANIMTRFSWGNCNNPSIYVDENMRNMAMNYRSLFANLAEALLKENKKIKARTILNLCEELFPDAIYPYDYFMISIGNSYSKIGDTKKAKEIFTTISNRLTDNIMYYMSIPESKKAIMQEEVLQDIGLAIELFQIANDSGNKKFAQQIAGTTTAFFEQYFSFIRQVSLCLPEEFETKNTWAFQLEGNLPYVAYWYNAMKIFIVSQTED